jgi:hypothetical protein
MLSSVGGFIAWIAGVVVLIKLFQKEGFLKGLIGFICMLYTFIWGWQNIGREELGLKTWMYVWTGAIVLGIILGVIGSMGGGGDEESLRLLFSFI